MILQKINKTTNFIVGLFWFVKDFFEYNKLLHKDNIKEQIRLFPQLNDRKPTSHTFDAHYLYQNMWAFQHILTDRPENHIDIGSDLSFVAIISTVTKLTYIDIRPTKVNADNFHYKEGSVLKIPYPDNSVSSLSCMHVAEHVGLGRYGDNLNPLGTVQAIKELQRVLAPGGILYFSIPSGKPRTYFNAHRVLNPKQILAYFNELQIIELSGVLDTGKYNRNIDINILANSRYANGLYKLIKPLN